MKYETLVYTRSGYIIGVIPVVFNFVNNIDHIVCLFYKEGNDSPDMSGVIDSYSVSGNSLTVNLNMTFGMANNYLFLIATVATY